MHPLLRVHHRIQPDRPGKIMIHLFMSFWVCFLFTPLLATSLFSVEPQISKLHRYIDYGGYAIQVDGKIANSFNANTHFVPASTIKILTSLIALEILGPQYRFATYFYMDNAKNLYIKGEGDPFLVSENVATIAEQLKKLDIHEISTLFLDDTAFALESPPDGSSNSDNPYDAHSGALAVNFNALPFQILENGTVRSDEKQTPLLPLMSEIGSSYKTGGHRVNVNANDKSSNTLRYTGELFTAIFSHSGLQINNGFAAAEVSRDAKLIYTYQSEKTVEDLVRSTLLYSSNFIANQLFLSSGKRLFGTPATWLKSTEMAKKFINLRLQLHNGSIQMVDGSGLSPRNRITPSAMLTILDRFKPHAALLKQQGEILLKSGTFTNTYCYAGFFRQNGELSPFVLFLNQKRNTRKTLLKLMQNNFLSQVSR